MAHTHNLGFPRIGARRELKLALEAYWKNESPQHDLLATGAQLRQVNWRAQHGLDWLPVGDFSFYDHVLDMSFALGNLPARVRGLAADSLDNYFRIARGRSAGEGAEVTAGEMTKWFDTNYHYIVPELDHDTVFAADPERLVAQFAEARAIGRAKPVLVGPVTYLWLGKTKDGSDRLALLPRLLVAYRELLVQLGRAGAEWVQIDEPALAMELSPEWQAAFQDGLYGARHRDGQG